MKLSVIKAQIGHLGTSRFSLTRWDEKGLEPHPAIPGTMHVE
jgi:hypothetical protein